MNKFKTFLHQNGFSPNSINRKIKHVLRFKKWLLQEHITLNNFDYPKAIQYIEWEQINNIQRPTLLHYINHIRQFFDFLKAQKQIQHNPFDNIHIKAKIGAKPKVKIQDLLKPEQLKDIFEAYKANPRINQRDKVLLSLLSFQGIAVAETKLIQVKHLNLDKATIKIPPSKMYAARKLPLIAQQILLLALFIQNKPNEHFLFEYKNLRQAANSRTHLCQQIRKEIHKHKLKIDFINLAQIRKANIVHWVKQHNLRKAQYLAGHRSVFTTEQYQVQNIQQLAQQVNKYHPLQLLNQK